MNGISLISMLLNGTSMNSCHIIEWIHTKVKVIEWDISEFNAILNGIPLKSMLLNGT
jgi:hypothetical protein